MEKRGKSNEIIEPENIKKSIGRRVRIARECKKVTQEQLAEKLDVSARQVAHLESGNRGLILERAEIIVDYLDCTLDYIYRDKSRELELDPVCQLVSDAMSNINDEAEKDLFIKAITNISLLFMNHEDK